mgnify:CR=1 FL=1
MTNGFMLEVGVIMLVAFTGAALAGRFKQSAILGYIAAGIFIGPFIHIEIGGLSYHGLIHDTSLINAISQLGIILLMFFVGLKFSITKLHKVRRPAIILSIFNIGINLFTGVLLGTALGWPFMDTLFLALIVSMSSAGVALKSLLEMDRLNNAETDFLLGVMVAQDFISSIFLALLGGLVVKSGGNVTVMGFIVGVAIFIVFFVVLALVVIPRTISYLVKMKNDEMFVLFALGLVCLSAALAEFFSIPGMIGAFFIGMTFAETRITDRIEEKIAPFRDAFVAVFFMAFGMMIDPTLFPSVIGIVALAVVLVILDDVFLTAVVSFFMGYTPRQSLFVSTSMCARGDESILYASIARQAASSTKGAELYPLAGAFTFVLSAVCPFLMRRSYRIADALARKMPHFIKYSAGVISRTLGKIILPGDGFRLYKGSRSLLCAELFYLACMIALILTNGQAHYIAFGLTIAASLIVWVVLQNVLGPIVRQINYYNLCTVPGSHMLISRYVASLVMATLMTAACVAFTFSLYWPTVLLILMAYLMWFILLMKVFYDQTCADSRYAKHPLMPYPSYSYMHRPSMEVSDSPRLNHRKRWKEF